MGILKRISNFIFGKKRPTYHTTPLEEDRIRNSEIFQEMSKKLQTYDAQLSEISAKKRQIDVQKINQQLEEKKIDELNRQDSELRKKEYSNSSSFRNLFYLMFNNKKFRKSLEIVDKDDVRSFGKFGDIIVLNNGDMAVVDSNGNILSQGRSIRQIIHKPESLTNQVKRKRILLPCDKNYIFYPDLESYEINECTYDEKTDKIKWAKVREEPLKQMILKREQRISQDRQYIERLEKMQSEQVTKIKDLNRKLNVLENKKEVVDSELSKSLEIQKQTYEKIGNLQKKIITLSGSKEILDDMRNRLENVNKKLLERVEEMNAQSKFREVLGTVQNLVEWSKLQVGDTIVEKKEEIKVPVQPGERLR